MIERYTLPEIQAVWSDEKKLHHWLNIEVAACEAMVEKGLVPAECLTPIKEKAAIDIDRMLEIEAVVHHDVIAFLTMLSEKIGAPARFLHLGLTSSDILDTTLGLQFKESLGLISLKIDQLLAAIKKQACKHKLTPIMGRSHGIHAEPTTFGLKLAIWYEEMRRHKTRLEQTLPRVAVGKISGPVGNYSLVEPYVEEYVCQKLGLVPAKISSQIIQRDRHAEYLSILALLASSLDKIATEIRALQKTEVREVEEPFRKGQKGSSAMPHKRNPIICERISGMSRLVRANAQAGFENVALWHERDISHSSVERIILPDSSYTIFYMLHQMTRIIADLTVFPDNMQLNIDKSHGLYFSQRLMLELVLRGLTREKAYTLVQRNAMESWKTKQELKNIILKDDEFLSILPPAELEKCFDISIFLKHAETIFERVFENENIDQP
ncbi:adenylosuccinate lyase [candidate division CSSED10-310 bacterium]|uniref:Adenylosuccinate lyase n=1 Tax=candidate division CSSED10-310 bacterium TaxID=2855610 RepID=A0ABV6Z602_UNCC1